MKAFGIWTLAFASLAFGIFAAGEVRAAENSIFLSPPSGTRNVGSVFEVSVFLNTGGEIVNAFEIFLEFPVDKLQVVSPSTGSSITEIWTTQPRYNNQTGTVELRGGIPRGINVRDGLITTITFRARSTGTAIVRFKDSTRIFLNDGKGTSALYGVQNGIYTLRLPPPAGPIVVSETHPVQGQWYKNATALLAWASEEAVGGYSYMLSDTPIDIPDDISEGLRTGVSYQNLSDGIHYFHLKALREGRWGGVSHFALQIDAAPPADFPIAISPSRKTSDRQPVLRFSTTDAHSGISFYELNIIPLQGESDGQEFFTEARSPFVVSPLELGAYDIIVRAYDNAGNVREVSERLHITTAFFRFIGGEGIAAGRDLVIPWFAVWGAVGALILLIGFAGWRLKRLHRGMEAGMGAAQLPPDIRSKLEELKEYQKKYGKTLGAALLFVGLSLLAVSGTLAQNIGLEPPFISTISKNISNEEIFYAGGKTEAGDIEVVLYLQNLKTGETLTAMVASDRKGDWLYRHDRFLSSGDYLLWAQSKLGGEVSPPSPQIRLTVRATAIQFGSSRISYEVLYLGVSAVLFAALAAVGIYTLIHARRARRRHKAFLKEMREAEESIRRGFAVLKRDIEAELETVKKAKLSKEFSEEEHRREEQLLKDLAWAEQHIGREVWDIRGTEHSD